MIVADDLGELIEELLAGYGPDVIDYAKVEPEKVSWLWPGRIPAAKLVGLDGDPNTAKSTLSLDLAAHVSTGTRWPDGAPCPEGNVLLLSAEDGAADTITPRLIAAGANRDRIRGLLRVSIKDKDGVPHEELPSLPRDIGVLTSMASASDVKLIIIDVLMAFLSDKVDSHRDQDVRGVLAQLADLAESTGATILLIRHLNKTTGGNPLYRGGGSIGIVGAARAAFLVARDPDDSDRLILAATKSNLAAMPPALAFRLVTDNDLGCGKIEWETEPVEYTAGQLLRDPHPDPDDADDRREIDAWLEALLADGRMESAKVYEQGKAAGYSRDQLKRAKKRLKIDPEHPVIPGPWYWALPPRERQGAQGSGHPEPRSLGSLGRSLGDSQDAGDRDRPPCRVCGQPLPDWIIQDGYDTHPACDLQETP